MHDNVTARDDRPCPVRWCTTSDQAVLDEAIVHEEVMSRDDLMNRDEVMILDEMTGTNHGVTDEVRGLVRNR